MAVSSGVLALLLLAPVAPAPQSGVGGGGAALLTGEELVLWPGGAPGSEGLTFEETLTERSQDPGRQDRIFTRVLRPSLRVHRPTVPTGVAVVVVPGGGYQRVVIDKEGLDICRWLNGLGITAFVLKYRLPDEGHENPVDVPLEDGQRAIRVLRSRAGGLGIDPHRIGMIGFSAGGHLVGAVAGYPGAKVYVPRDLADSESARPDFIILGYAAAGFLPPVPPDHGALPPRRQVLWKYPIDGGITKDFPPAFLFHAGDDPTVPVEGSMRIYRALKEAGIPAELHIFKSGGHGFGIKDAVGSASSWPAICAEWLRALGLAK